MNIKNLFTLTVIILFFYSCDPIADMDANIKNSTSQTLSIKFISSFEDFNKTLNILPNEVEIFQESFEIGATFLEPSFVEYDSVVIKNESDQILKIYKANSIGKNMYNIDDYWLLSKPSKNFYIYDYNIESEDLE